MLHLDAKKRFFLVLAKAIKHEEKTFYFLTNIFVIKYALGGCAGNPLHKIILTLNKPP
jgi:hypothetical protein